MSLQIRCNSCDYNGTVSPAKAGKTVPCPSCDEPLVVPARSDKRHQRPHSGSRTVSDNSTTGRTILFGCAILLMGVVVMLVIRMRQIPEEFLAETPSDPGISTPEDTISVPGDRVDPAPTVNETPPNTVTTDVNESNVSEIPEPTAGSNGAPVVAIGPEQLLMAGMTEMVVRVTGFRDDVRGTVATAVEVGTRGAMEQCRLKCTEGPNKPVMSVTLQLLNRGGINRLSMSAELQADLQGVLVKLWERTESIAVLDDRALRNGILPPNLNRDIGAFFTTLRDEFVRARRAVASMELAKKRRAEPSKSDDKPQAPSS